MQSIKRSIGYSFLLTNNLRFLNDVNYLVQIISFLINDYF